MSRPGLVVLSVLGIWLSAILQQSLAPYIAIGGVQPDFLLVLLGTASLFMNRGPASGFGFGCGFVEGAIAGVNLTHYGISRSIAGFVASWSRAIGFELNVLVAVVTAALTTLVAGLVYMFGAAPHGVGRFLGDTIGSAVYDGVLAIPVYLLLKRVVNPRARFGL